MGEQMFESHMDATDILEDDCRCLVGMKRQDAIEECFCNNIPVRISSVDGKAQILTRDYKPERLNLEIECGIVVAVHYG